MTERIYVGPKIIQLFEDQNFSTKLNSRERRAWKLLKMSAKGLEAMKKRKISVKLCRS
jgi:hypothetical protein